MTDKLDAMNLIARSAGAAILDIYAEADFGVETKADDSPLTRADLAAHRIIVAGLRDAFPDIPVLSEESDGLGFEQRRQWQSYFLVDPLDGTKEFISRNGEFTVNIAFIDQHVPVTGVVYVPVKDVLYAGDRTEGRATAWVESASGRSDIRVRALDQQSPLTVVASRRHGGEALQACMQTLESHFEHIETTNMGSSLKLCLVAEGKADLYPRLAPTSEWDTAAAQAVVEAAGGRVVDMAFNDLRYNTKEDILNPFFYVVADTSFDWHGLLRDVSIP